MLSRYILLVLLLAQYKANAQLTISIDSCTAHKYDFTKFLTVFVFHNTTQHDLYVDKQSVERITALITENVERITALITENIDDTIDSHSPAVDNRAFLFLGNVILQFPHQDAFMDYMGLSPKYWEASELYEKHFLLPNTSTTERLSGKEYIVIKPGQKIKIRSMLLTNVYRYHPVIKSMNQQKNKIVMQLLVKAKYKIGKDGLEKQKWFSSDTSATLKKAFFYQLNRPN